jgi:uncharacterized phage-like protein YoqJ
MKISGTGNRELFHTKEDVEKQIENRLIELQATEVISGMALGFDQLLAGVAIKLGIPVIAAVPIAEQAKLWNREQVEEYMKLLSLCHRVEIVTEGSYATWKMHKRNEWMVNNSDLLLAYNNKTDGGAVACVSYALKVGRKVINLFD